MLLVGYNWRSFRNLGTQEAMDAAQVARNLAEGRGFTTQFIRPFSIYLVKKRNEAKFGDSSAEVRRPARITRNSKACTRTWRIRRSIPWCWRA